MAPEPAKDMTRTKLSPEIFEASLKRTLSSAERSGIKSALDVVVAEKDRLVDEGLSQPSFFLGICNLVVTALVFAKWPWHLWVLYGAKCAILIPAWWMESSRLYSGALFVLDFCWIANICFGVYIAMSLLKMIPVSLQSNCFLVFFAFALGPLSWACVLLHNGIVFHHVIKLASLFIHFTPLLVAYTILYYQDQLNEAWPGCFIGLKDLENFTRLDVYLHGLGFYTVWWILHSLWLTTVGVDSPMHGHSTVFDGLYKKHKLDALFSKMTGLKSIRSHAMIYLCLHFVAVNAGLGWAALCFNFYQLHIVFGCFVFLSAAWFGAGYYDYMMAEKYTAIVQKVLEETKNRSLLAAT